MTDYSELEEWKEGKPNRQILIRTILSVMRVGGLCGSCSLLAKSGGLVIDDCLECATGRLMLT